MVFDKPFSNKGLLVLGALNANEKDRKIEQRNAQLVQFIYKDQIYPVNLFSNWEDIGVSSLCMSNTQDNLLYVTSRNNLYTVDLSSGKISNLNVSGLTDVHEIIYKDGVIWIANTGEDNIIAFNPEIGSIEKKVSLSKFATSEILKENVSSCDVDFLDTFHVNQAFFDYNGDMCSLTHHVTGRQIKSKQQSMQWLKKQGNGGILNISKNTTIPLNLRSPHSVRLINNHYYICDSAAFCVRVYNTLFELQKSIGTSGYARGMDHDPIDELLFVGNSSVRKRYRNLLRRNIKNNVEAYNLKNHKRILQLNIPNVEQINNVYLLSASLSTTVFQHC